MRLPRLFVSLIREGGLYAVIIALGVGVVLWAPRSGGKDPRIHPVPSERTDAGERSLLDRPVNERGDTALHVAVRDGNTERIFELIKGNADPTIENKDGVTPLDLANARGQEDIIGLLTSGRFRGTVPDLDAD